MSRKTIILGFDGLDPRRCKKWMVAGQLPNLSKLAGIGSFQELNTSYPCQSPVAWRTLLTGVNPGNHGVFDFLRKIPGTYLPDIATVERSSMLILPEDWKRFGLGMGVGALGALGALGITSAAKLSRRRFISACVGVPIAVGATSAVYSWLPKEIPAPKNRTGGTPFWAHVGEEGLRCKALRIPVEFPARDYPNCQVLSGLGVPDICATNGTYTVFTTANENADTEMGGRIVPLNKKGDKLTAQVSGPPDVFESGKRLTCELSIQKTETGVRVNIGGEEILLKSGQWSKWLNIPFSASPLMRLHGKARFHLLSSEPRLYLSPINFDPADLPPNIRMSSPENYAGKLAGANGFYKTLGWPTDTWSLNEEQVPDEVYLNDYKETMRMEKALTLKELGEDDWDCFFAVFTPTDQIQHVFRFGTERGDKALLEAYKEVDAFVGEVMNRFIKNNTALMVLSDHGFHSFDKAVNLNTWLWRNGYLKFEGEVLPDAPQKKLKDLAERGTFWEKVDWKNTYAYSMGLGNIYLNLKGREPEGFVRPGGYAKRVLQKLKEGLFSLKDTGQPVVRSVYLGKELYQGKYINEAADVVVGFHDGYRVSWQTALGGTPKDIIEVNDKKWSGDHCSLDPAETPGVLFSNRPVKQTSKKKRNLGGGVFPSVMDIAPTVMASLDLPVPDVFEGESLYA